MTRLLILAAVMACSAPAPALADGMEPAQTQRVEHASKQKPKQRKRRKARVQPPSFDVTTTAAWRYGQLTQAECEAEVKARGLPFSPEPTTGVAGGGRITGPIRGVTYRSRLSAKQRATSPWEIADCRLVLALDDLAVILVAHDIVEVRHYSMYRVKPRGQHHAGLAIDAAIFTRRDGTQLDVLADWHGRIGAKTCGPDAGPRKRTEKAIELRELLCEIVDKRIFNVILTPNHDRAHRNHFHLDITPGARWFIVD